MLARLAPLGLLSALALLAACGSSSGPVLEKVKEPPGSTLRVDVLIPHEVRSCAIGEVCRFADQSECFTLSDASGPRLSFRPDAVWFVPPDSPDIAQAPQSGCFRLVIDTDTRAAVESAFNQLRQQAFQMSDGEVLLDLRLHDFASIDAGFKYYDTGIFLQPAALEQVGFPVISRETDYVFSITGLPDLSSGFAPEIDACAGTNWQAQGAFGGTGYTWVSARCTTSSQLLWHFLAQTYFELRDVVHFQDVYRGNYPSCGRAAADPRDWFPRVMFDCPVDPDSPTCGSSATCGTSQGIGSFVRHILAEHWPKSVEFVGNHCGNGIEDGNFGEVGVDTGGDCDLIGR
jgi:hypothetical protein